MKTWLPLAFILLFSWNSFSQSPRVDRIEPPNWWTGMRLNAIQLILYGENLKGVTASIDPPLLIKKIHTIKNPSYAFIDVEIPPGAPARTYELALIRGNAKTVTTFTVNEREPTAGRHQGFGPEDVIYLITPDRFVNGDSSNDDLPGMHDRYKPDHPYGRHGGDIQGIINKLDYLKDLGVTALWMNPLVENNTNASSYHGYATTDMYRIDPRFGTNELYVQLVNEAHARSIKIIMDHVNNHISISHPWIRNLPTPDWLNGTVQDHQKAFHSKIEISDPYTDPVTKQKPMLGWFTDYMPDLNQNNPFVRHYLIQNTIWWIEYTGLDGIREDTYPYVDQRFLSEWCSMILKEYPNFTIVGEVWVQEPVYLAPYQHGSPLAKDFDTNLQSITDFGLFDAFIKVFEDGQSIDLVFQCLSKDFVYANPSMLVTFLDNHDIRRIMYQVKGDAARLKLALTLLLTTRGIPQLLYGTEIGLLGGRDHGSLRANFPGGFPDDVRDAFTRQGRTTEENDIFDHVRRLLALRKKYRALASGNLTHYRPSEELYVYFRSSGDETIMVAVNNSSTRKSIQTARFTQELGKARLLKDLYTGRENRPGGDLHIDGLNSRMYLIVH